MRLAASLARERRGLDVDDVLREMRHGVTGVLAAFDVTSGLMHSLDVVCFPDVAFAVFHNGHVERVAPAPLGVDDEATDIMYGGGVLGLLSDPRVVEGRLSPPLLRVIDALRLSIA